MIPIKSVILEGPDCCGKSTLYRELHKVSKFGYHLIDRGRLSRLCYSRLYDRGTVDLERAALHEELCDVNNVLVVLMPPKDELLQRLSVRGDEAQDSTSLEILRRLYEEEIERIRRLPNVFVLRSAMSPTSAAAVVDVALQKYSGQTPGELGGTLPRWTSIADEEEVQLRCSFDVDPQHSDPGVMNDPKEGDYYLDITKRCEDIIQSEISGRNPYNKPQDSTSRRFYYSSDTCIASIHFLPRRGSMRVICTLRSTDAQRNGSLDLRFLAHLAAGVPRTFGWPSDKIRLDVMFNSLHVRRDV